MMENIETTNNQKQNKPFRFLKSFNNKKVLKIISFVLILLALPLSIILIRHQQELRKEASIGEEILVDIWPKKIESPTQEFSIEVRLIPLTAPARKTHVAGVDLKLDKDLFNIKQVSCNTSIFPLTISNEVDQDQGNIYLTCSKQGGQESQEISETITLGTITLEPKTSNIPQETTVEFTRVNIPEEAVFENLANIPTPLTLSLGETKKSTGDINRFSFNLSVPYNSSGKLSLGNQELVTHINQKIKNLEGEENQKIEIVSLAGKTGLIPKFKNLDESSNCSNNEFSCRNAHFKAEPESGWSFIENILNLNSDSQKLIEIDLPNTVSKTSFLSKENVPYLRDSEDVEVLKNLLFNALENHNFKERIKYWSIGSIESGSWRGEEKIQTDQGEVLLLAYAINQLSKTIKSSCSDCKVILSPGDAPYHLNYDYYKQLITDLDKLNNPSGNNFDVFAFILLHNRDIQKADWKNLKSIYNNIQQLLQETSHSNVPIWITSTNSWSGAPDGFPERSQDYQANQLIKRFVYPFSLGIKKVFWGPGLIEYEQWNGNTNHYMTKIGLLDKEGNGKKSYQVLNFLIDKLDSFNSVETLYSPEEIAPTHPTQPNLYLLKFNFSNPSKKPFYVFWNEIFTANTPTVNLSDKIQDQFQIITETNTTTGESISSVLINNFPKFAEEKITTDKNLQEELDYDSGSEISILLKFQAIKKKGNNHNINLKFFKEEAEVKSFENVEIASDDNGVYSADLENLAPGNYDLYVKGWAHLQKKFENVLIPETGSVDLTDQEIIAGNCVDSNPSDPGIINISDFSFLAARYMQSGTKADFDDSGTVNIADFSILASNYQKTGEE